MLRKIKLIHWPSVRLHNVKCYLGQQKQTKKIYLYSYECIWTHRRFLCIGNLNGWFAEKWELREPIYSSHVSLGVLPSTVSEHETVHETVGCSLSAPSSRLEEASCAPAAVPAEERGLWWRVTDRKWGGGGGGERRRQGSRSMEGGKQKQHVEVKVTAKHLVKDIISQGGKWRKWQCLPNLFQSQINEPKHLDNNWWRNIPSCYSTGVNWPHTWLVWLL